MMKNKVLKIFCLFFVASIMVFSFGCKRNVFDANYLMEASLPLFVRVEKTKNIKSVKDELQQKIYEFENTFNVKNENSVIYKVNLAKAGEPVMVNKLFYDVFNLSKNYYEKNNNFNPALFPIIKLWKLDNFDGTTIGAELESIPSNSEIDALLKYCKMENFEFELVSNNYFVTKKFSESELDFGGIAKGYFSDYVVRFLKQRGIKNSLVNYAGNISYGVYKSGYIPEIQIKNDVNKKLTSVDISFVNASVVTSGHYQRYYTYKGEIISHILNADGRQGLKEISGVTVIDGDGAKCDVLATISCNMTKSDAISFLNLNNVLYFIVDKDGNEIKNF